MSAAGRIDELGADGRPARLGIFGGTFDPIHMAHLIAAEQARQACALDAVLFVPTGVPVFKRDRCLASAEDRLAMCRLAVADNPDFAVSAIEIDRTGDTYTVDTLEQLRRRYPDCVSFHFIVGQDVLATMEQWRDVARVAQLTSIIALDRPGSARCNSDVLLHDRFGLDIAHVDMPAMDISSSMLRDTVEQGRSVRYLTPLSVCSFIAAHGLYGGAR